MTLLADLVATSAAVAATSGRTAKTEALADLLRKLDPDEVEVAVDFLTGTIRSIDGLASDDMRRGLPRFQSDNLAQNARLVDAVKAFAAQRGCTPGQLALAWVISRDEHLVAIPGTKRRARLEENVAAAGITLTQEEIRAIDELLPPDAVAGARYPDSMLELVNR